MATSSTSDNTPVEHPYVRAKRIEAEKEEARRIKEKKEDDRRIAEGKARDRRMEAKIIPVSFRNRWRKAKILVIGSNYHASEVKRWSQIDESYIGIGAYFAARKIMFLKDDDNPFAGDWTKVSVWSKLLNYSEKQCKRFSAVWIDWGVWQHMPESMKKAFSEEARKVMKENALLYAPTDSTGGRSKFLDEHGWESISYEYPVWDSENEYLYEVFKNIIPADDGYGDDITQQIYDKKCLEEKIKEIYDNNKFLLQMEFVDNVDYALFDDKELTAYIEELRDELDWLLQQKSLS